MAAKPQAAACRTNLEMSALIQLEMSSFGRRSGGERTLSGRGANGVVSEGAGPHGGDAAGERGRAVDVGGRGAAGRDATPHEASDAAFRARGRRLGVRASPETMRAWLTQAGRWRGRRKRAKHRSRRPRRAALGELVQWDSSVHPWIEDRGPDDLVLVAMHDDATSRMCNTGASSCATRARRTGARDHRVHRAPRLSAGGLRRPRRALRPRSARRGHHDRRPRRSRLV